MRLLYFECHPINQFRMSVKFVPFTVLKAAIYKTLPCFLRHLLGGALVVGVASLFGVTYTISQLIYG